MANAYNSVSRPIFQKASLIILKTRSENWFIFIQKKFTVWHNLRPTKHKAKHCLVFPFSRSKKKNKIEN